MCIGISPLDCAKMLLSYITTQDLINAGKVLAIVVCVLVLVVGIYMASNRAP